MLPAYFSPLHRIKQIVFSVLLLFLSSKALSSGIDTASLINMSLEELLDIKVSIASRTSERVSTAPGNVSVYSHQEIRAFGARNLRDILNRMTSMWVATSHVLPQHKLSIRGVNTGSNDTNILLLINGNPVRNANAGGSNAAIYSGFPVSTIDHIEIIRGPGSVLYGSNAFAGVINIVTKTGQSTLPTSNIKATLGSFNRKSLEMSSQFSDQGYDVLVGINSEQSDGDTFEEITDQFGNTGQYSSGLTQTTAVASGTISNFNFTLLYTDYEADNGGGLFRLRKQSSEDEKKYVAVSYHHDLAENWGVDVSYIYNDQVLDWDINNSQNSHQVNDSLEQIAEVITRGRVFDDMNVIFGASRSMLKGEFLSSETPHEFWRQSYFTQAATMITPTTNLIVGFQWNHPEESDSDLSSRFSIIKQFGESWWLKFSYGEAFRSPFGTELFADSPGLQGNLNLTPERMETYETQLSYADRTKQLSLSLYHSTQKDTINQTAGGTQAQSTFVNQGNFLYQGVEVEGKISITESVGFSFNASYQTTETDTAISDDSFGPKEMIKAGIDYKYSDVFSIALFNRYIGKNTDLNETKGIPITNQVPEAYHLLTVNMRWDLNRYVQPSQFGAPSISLYLDNLLNEEVFSPDSHDFGKTNSIPSHNGFSANLSFQYEF